MSLVAKILIVAVISLWMVVFAGDNFVFWPILLVTLFTVLVFIGLGLYKLGRLNYHFYRELFRKWFHN